MYIYLVSHSLQTHKYVCYGLSPNKFTKSEANKQNNKDPFTIYMNMMIHEWKYVGE